MQLVRLPTEIQQQILEHVAISEAIMATPMDIDASSDPMIPPADGSSPLLALPKELRRAIFGYILPPKDKIIEPYKTLTQPQKPRLVAPVAPNAPGAPAALLVPFLQANLHHIAHILQNNPNVPAHMLQALQNVATQMLQNNQPVPANILQIIQNAATQTPPSVPPQPNTQQTGSAASVATSTAATAATAATSETAKKKKKKPALAVGDALVLCKQIASEILVMLYEERTFAMNVYEGISDGGIEFLNSGRQRLQYRENFTQVRFKRFEGPDDPFGFSRIKRLMVRIYPASETALEQKNSRHNAMHTHFMIRALVKLLKHDGSFGLNRLQIRFVEPRSHLWRPYPWQNTADFSLRSSSIHGISNIEVILRGLLELRQVQTAVCELPPSLYRDSALNDFIDHLLGVITNKLHPGTMDDEIAVKIEGARDMLDDWIHSSMFSTATSRAMPAFLKDSDFNEVQDAYCFDSYPDEDNYYDIPARPDVKSKSVTNDCSPPLRDAYGERITSINGEGERAWNTEHHSSNNRVSPSGTNGHNDDGSARTCTTRRPRFGSLLSSSSRESSGGASLLEMVSINDEDALPRLNSLVHADLTSPKNRRTRSTAHRTNNHGSVAKPELRRSERVRARNSTDNAIPTTNEHKSLSFEELVFNPLSAVEDPLPAPARANGSDDSYSDPFDSSSRFLNSIRRQASKAQDQPPSDALDQTAGNSIQDNRRTTSSKQNMSQDIINLEEDK